MSIYGDTKGKGAAPPPLPAASSKLKDRQAAILKAEERQRVKNAAQAAKTEAAEKAREEKKAEKARWTKTIKSSADRKRQREKDAYAGEDLAGSTVRIWKSTEEGEGKHVTEGVALFDIIEFLQQRPDYAEAALGEIRDGVGIDLHTHPGLLETLRKNKKVETVEEPGQPLRLRFLPAYGVRDRASLLHLLQHAQPGAADGFTEAVARAELTHYHETEVGGGGGKAGDKKKGEGLKKVYETFADIEQAINDAIDAGRCTVVERQDNKKQVLYAPLPGTEASEAMRALWHADSARVPKGDELQQTLLARKVRTKDELTVRKQRKAAEQKARQEANARPKKRAATFRAVTNAHLIQDDPTLFGGQLRGKAAAMARAAQAPK